MQQVMDALLASDRIEGTRQKRRKANCVRKKYVVLQCRDWCHSSFSHSLPGLPLAACPCGHCVHGEEMSTDRRLDLRRRKSTAVGRGSSRPYEEGNARRLLPFCTEASLPYSYVRVISGMHAEKEHGRGSLPFELERRISRKQTAFRFFVVEKEHLAMASPSNELWYYIQLNKIHISGHSKLEVRCFYLRWMKRKFKSYKSRK